MNVTTSQTGASDNGHDGSSAGAMQSDSGEREGAGFAGKRRPSASLRDNLSSMKDDLDALVNRAGSMSEQELSEAHSRMMSQFSSMRHAARGMATQATRQLNRSVDVTTDYVKDKPMQSVAVAAGLGLAIGMLFMRR